MPRQARLRLPTWDLRDTARSTTVDTAMSSTVTLARLSRRRRLYHMFPDHTPLLLPTCWTRMFLESSLQRMASTLTAVMLQDSVTLQSLLRLRANTTLVVTPLFLEVLEQSD